MIRKLIEKLRGTAKNNINWKEVLEKNSNEIFIYHDIGSSTSPNSLFGREKLKLYPSGKIKLVVYPHKNLEKEPSEYRAMFAPNLFEIFRSTLLRTDFPHIPHDSLTAGSNFRVVSVVWNEEKVHCVLSRNKYEQRTPFNRLFLLADFACAQLREDRVAFFPANYGEESCPELKLVTP